MSNLDDVAWLLARIESGRVKLRAVESGPGGIALELDVDDDTLQQLTNRKDQTP